MIEPPGQENKQEMDGRVRQCSDEVLVRAPPNQQETGGQERKNPPAKPGSQRNTQAQARKPVTSFLPLKQPRQGKNDHAGSRQHPGSSRRRLRRPRTLL